MGNQRLNCIHISCSDVYAGASRAGYRIHNSISSVLHESWISRMLVCDKFSDDVDVIKYIKRWGLRARALGLAQVFADRAKAKFLPLLGAFEADFKTGNPVHHSFNKQFTGILAHPIVAQSDVINLHWIGRLLENETVSIEEIGKSVQPLVWTLHDQWAFCGAEHYTSPSLPGETASSDERFAEGYSPASRPAHEAGPDLNRRTWLRKLRAWRRPIHIVCPSQWMADCVRRSTLMGDWPITVIPNPIHPTVWAPTDQAQARALLGLPAERPLVLFGAMGGSSDPRKGADLLLEALQCLRSQVAGTPLEHLELVVFGQSRPAQPPDLGFPIHYSGHLHDDLSLRLLYAAADVFVIPSRQDNLPNTGLEAHACGTPVVAFATGGLVDIVDPEITGSLAEPFDPLSLAAAIRWVLEDPQRRRQLGAAARQRAERLWDPARVAGLYAEVYGQAVERGLQTRSGPPSLR